jgi:two-component system chemotaxis sensor kinase CheA
MNDELKIMQELMATFKVELEEHLQAINKLLLAAEEAGGIASQEQMQEIFRQAHSLKGAARAVGLKEIEQISHKLENIFTNIREQQKKIPAWLFDLFYQCLDQIPKFLDSSKQNNKNLAKLLSELETVPEKLKKLPDLVVNQDSNQLKTASKNKISKPKKNLGEETIRVKTTKLDTLMAHVEELLTAKIRAEHRLADLKGIANQLSSWNKDWFKIKSICKSLTSQATSADFKALSEFIAQGGKIIKDLTIGLNQLSQSFSRDTLTMSIVTSSLQQDIRQLRMLPIATIFNSYQRMVRDLAHQQGKKVSLHISGLETELDKKLLEEIKDPIMHMLRNAIDHGIELPSKRLALGKSEAGNIWLRASRQGSNVVVEVEDDGAGISTDKVKKIVVEKNLATEDELKQMTDRQIIDYIFALGFSTSSKVTDVSGRGVGLDIVRRNIEKLNGLVDLQTFKDKGTKIKLSLPLTLSTARVLLVEVGRQTYALPTSSIERIIRVKTNEVSVLGSGQAIKVGGQPIPLFSLSQLLKLPHQQNSINKAKFPVVVIGSAEKRLGLIVDALVGETEIVIKSLGPYLKEIPNVSGGTILGDGRVVIILNPADLVKAGQNIQTNLSHLVAKTSETKSTKNILVVDDSVTTRTLEKNILEAHGYQVITASNGSEALSTLEKGKIDLVISDINMPILDGLKLTSTIRHRDSLSKTPVILVSVLDSDSDIQKGIECGADAYITKSSFSQQELLETVSQLI